MSSIARKIKLSAQGSCWRVVPAHKVHSKQCEHAGCTKNKARAPSEISLHLGVAAPDLWRSNDNLG